MLIPKFEKTNLAQVQASTTEELKNREPGLYQTGTTTRLYTWQELIDNNKIVVGAVPDTSNTVVGYGNFYVSDLQLSGDLICDAVSDLVNLKQAFYSCKKLTSVDIRRWNTSNVTNMAYMFSSSSMLEAINFGNIDTSKVTIMLGMFKGCSSLKSLDLSQLDLSKVTTFENFFCKCTSLESIDFGDNNLESNKNMTGMFDSCSSLKSLDLSNFDTSNVTGMFGTFLGCNLTTLNISSFDFSSVTLSYIMFGYSMQDLISSGLTFEQANAIFAKNTPEEKAKEMIAQMQMTEDDEDYAETLEMCILYFSTNFDQIIAPTALPSGLQIALPTTYNSVVNGVTGTDEINYLISGANTTLVKAISGAVDTGIATDLFSFAVTGLIIIALAVVCFKKKKLGKKFLSKLNLENF